MSYDFHLVPCSEGQDPLASARSFIEQDEEEINPGPLNPEKEERKKMLADNLMNQNPALEVFSFGYGEIAKMQGWAEEEARIRYRHIELNGPDDGNGIQITLYDDAADITVPYWHEQDAVGGVFDEIWAYLTILVEHGSFNVYDPQLDRILDLSSDRDDAIKRYSGVMEKIPDMIANSSHAKKPWWKFW